MDTSPKRKNTKVIGDLGETIAVQYLQQRGFTILDTNYWHKWGEIDIIAEKRLMVHFVEVKTVSYETRKKLQEALMGETWRPEEQVHKRKIHQIEKALETWFEKTGHKGDFQIDVLAVRMVQKEKYATVNQIEHVAFEA